jgi:hypothetical protein
MFRVGVATVALSAFSDEDLHFDVSFRMETRVHTLQQCRVLYV